MDRFVIPPFDALEIYVGETIKTTKLPEKYRPKYERLAKKLYQSKNASSMRKFLNSLHVLKTYWKNYRAFYNLLWKRRTLKK